MQKNQGPKVRFLINALCTILRAIAIVVGIIITGIIILIIYASVDKVDTFYMDNAELVSSTFLYEIDKKFKDKKNEYYSLSDDQLNVHAHRIKKGQGTILAYRWYSNGGFFRFDDERFKKLTIWLSSAKLRQGRNISLQDNSDVVVVYTRGASAWPRAACAGYVTSGSLTLEYVDNVFHVILDGNFSPAGLGYQVWKHCEEHKIEMNFIANKMDFDDLTPWLGKPADHPYHETYRLKQSGSSNSKDKQKTD